MQGGDRRLQLEGSRTAVGSCTVEQGGATVDEAALIAALQNGTILAAGLDVYEKEPLPTDSPLLTMPNVVALPHVGSATQETRHAMARLAVDNIIAAFAGRPQNIINPAVFARHAAASQ